MNRYRLVHVNVTDALHRELDHMPLRAMQSGAGHGGQGYGQGWIHGLSMVRVPPGDVGRYPALAGAIAVLCDYLPWYDVSQVMVNRLEAHQNLDQHRDGPSPCYRFHLPVVTSPDVFWWDEISKEYTHLERGYWHGPLPFAGVMHRMDNQSDTARIHVIVDLRPPQ